MASIVDRIADAQREYRMEIVVNLQLEAESPLIEQTSA